MSSENPEGGQRLTGLGDASVVGVWRESVVGRSVRTRDVVREQVRAALDQGRGLVEASRVQFIPRDDEKAGELDRSEIANRLVETVQELVMFQR